MTVYFIRSVGGHGPVKIGEAGDIGRRLAALATSSPYPLEVVAVLPGGFAQEAALHRLLDAARSHGEWFNPTPAVLAVVQFARSYALDVPADPEALSRAVCAASALTLSLSPSPTPKRGVSATVGAAMLGRVEAVKEPKRPPWQWAALLPLVAGVPPTDVEGRRVAFVEALRRTDHMHVADVAKHFAVTLRAIYRAREWMRDHAPDALASLRQRPRSLYAEQTDAAEPLLAGGCESR